MELNSINSQITQNQKTKKNLYFIFGLIFSFVILLSSVYFGYYYKKQKEKEFQHSTQAISYSYLIKGVPSFNIYNAVRVSEPAAALLAVLNYWGDFSEDPLKLSNDFPGLGNYSYDDLKKFFLKKGYSVIIERVKTINDLKKYINADIKTPLIVYQKPTIDYPSTGQPFRVIIGLDDNKRKVTVHDYWLGNNYEIDYDEFFKLWTSRRFLAVQPKNLKDALKLLSEKYEKLNYPNRPSLIDNKLKKMFVDYIILYFSNRSPAFAEDNITFINQQFIKNPDFELMPSVVKLIVYRRLAASYRLQKKYDLAIDAIKKAEDLNHNLNQPQGIWPAVMFTSADGRLHYPYIELARIYKNMGKEKLAIENYKKVLEIVPEHNEALRYLVGDQTSDEEK